MHSKLLRHAAALLAGFGLVAGLLGAAAAPAQAASFGVTISASATQVSVGQSVTLAGKVSPRPATRYVYLQRRYVGSTAWHTVKKVRTTRAGYYHVTVTPGNDDDRYYRIYKPKQRSRKAGRSAAVELIVDRVATTPATLEGITPGNSPLSGGVTLTISGTGLAGTSTVTFTPRVERSATKDGTGILPELRGTVTAVDDTTLTVRTPASLGGENLVKVYTPSGTLTSTVSYAAGNRGLTGFEQQVLDELNARRAVAQTCTENGRTTSMPAVAPVAWDGALSDLALSHSADLAARQDVYQGITHTTYGTASWTTRFQLAGVTGGYGEILALSPSASSAAEVVGQWMKSTAGHCTSVMNPNWTKAGVGVSTGAWQTSGGVQDSIFSNVDFQ